MTDATPPHRHPWLVPALIAVHVALSVFLSWNVCVWLDEVFTHQTSSQGPVHAYLQARDFELQPPLYFALLSFWLMISDAYFWGRLFSLGWSVGMLFTAAGLSRRWMPGIHPAWMVGALALNPYLVWASEEMRAYAMITCLGGLLLLVFHDTFMDDESATPAKRVLYGFLCLAAIYTQYYLGFLLVANAAGLVATRRWRALFQYLVVMAGVALFLIPIVATVSNQVELHTGTMTYDPPIHRAMALVLHNAQEMTLPLYSWFGRRWLALIGAMALAGGLSVLVGRRQVGPKQVALWASFGMAIAIFTWAVLFSGVELVTRRHCAGLFAMSTLLPFSVIVLLSKPTQKWVLLGWTCVILAANVYSLYEINKEMAKEGDSIRVADFIEAREKPNEPIFLFPREAELPFEVYYDGVNELYPIPDRVKRGEYSLTGGRLVSPEAVSKSFEVAGQHDRIWLVTTMKPSQDVYLGVTFNIRFLLTYLQENYRIITKKSFLGAELLLLRKR